MNKKIIWGIIGTIIAIFVIVGIYDILTVRPCSPNCFGKSQLSEIPSVTEKTELLSYSGDNYSWKVAYPETYKAVLTTDTPSPFYRLDIDSGEKRLCSIYLSMPTYKKSTVEEQGIENIFNKALASKTLIGSKPKSTENITLGNLTGTLFDYQENSLTLTQFIAKYSEKNLVGTFGLSCNNTDKESFANYRKEFMKIIESFE